MAERASVKRKKGGGKKGGGEKGRRKMEGGEKRREGEKGGGRKRRGEKIKEGEKKGGEKIKRCLTRIKPRTSHMVSHSSDHYMLSPQACDGRTIIIPTYTANLNCHELRVALLGALAPPIIFR